jgi:hypothetical protein
MDLIDASTDRRIGTSFTAVHSLTIRDGDLFNGDWKAAKDEKFYIRESDTSEKAPIGYFTAIIHFEADIVGLVCIFDSIILFNLTLTIHIMYIFASLPPDILTLLLVDQRRIYP